METMSDTAVLLKFFGLRPGSSRQDFVSELRALSAEERAELAAMAREALDSRADNAA